MPAIQNPSFPKYRHVLVAVAGQTPAIITETLWALEKRRNIRIDEIRIITTEAGRESVIRHLLGENGHFAKFCRDYEVPHGRISFSDKQIYLLRSSDGRPLSDIRSTEDNLAAADQVFALIRKWCEREEEVLLCSIAGGRKTLSVYLSMALMLCGRSRDRLYHVLVAPEFETGVRDFFYPPPEPTIYDRLCGFDESGKAIYAPISSDDADLQLADIPFPRLRQAIGGELPLEESLTEAVRHSQLILDYLQQPPLLTIYLKSGEVALGEFSFSLSRQLLATYLFFLTQCNSSQNGLDFDDLFQRRVYLAKIEREIDKLRHGEQERYAWESMGDSEDFRARIGPCISKVNRKINEVLGRNRLAERYRINTSPKYHVSIPDFVVYAEEGVPSTFSKVSAKRSPA